MVQDIIVVVLVLLAVVYAAFKIYRKIKPKQSDVCDTSPSGCGGCGEDCSLRDLKKK